MREIANPSEPDYQDIPEVAQISDSKNTPRSNRLINKCRARCLYPNGDRSKRLSRSDRSPKNSPRCLFAPAKRDRRKVWPSLTEAEKVAFTGLLTPTPEPTPELTPEPTPEPIPEPIPTSEPITEPRPPITTPVSAPRAESTAESRAEQVSEKDAEKMREIATIWWLEFYPDRMQSLVSQMYAWKAPGTKYETAVIVQWLEGEDDLIRDRINQLISLKNNNSLTDEETDTDYDE